MNHGQTLNQIAGLGFIFVVIAFSVLEFGRWKRPDLADVLTDTQKGRRIVGIVLLLVIGTMAYGGTYWPPPLLVPKVVRDMEVLYWLFFTLLTLFIPLIAFFEFKDSIRRASQLRREVYREIVSSPLDDLSMDNESTKKLP